MPCVVDSDIVVIRGANDILNSAYLSPIIENDHEFPSVEHYCLCEILHRAGLVAEIEDVINSPDARTCWRFVRNCILARLNDNADHFLTDVKDECLLIGLRLRFRQESSFRRALMDTGRALLVYCSENDYQYGTGMEEKSFLEWVESNGLKTDRLLDWFLRYDTCPYSEILGRNKLGLVLMDIRSEEMDRLQRPIPSAPARMSQMPPSLASIRPFARPPSPNSRPAPVPAISEPVTGAILPKHAMDTTPMPPKRVSKIEMEEFSYQRYVIPGQEVNDDGDWIVSDQILSLEGPFAVLSQYYPTPLVSRKRRYRSVEHYAYQKLFKKWKLGRKAKEKIVTTPDPSKVSGVARRMLPQFWKKSSECGERIRARKSDQNEGAPERDTRADNDALNADLCDRLLEYYERGTKLKFDQYPVLKRLLVATGDALLIETCPTTDSIMAYEWTICLEELDVQHFLTSSPYNTVDLLRFLLKSDQKLSGYFLNGIGRNRAGLALMRLRLEYRESNVELLHLPPPPPTGGELDENRLVCFTDTSVFHPYYVAPFWTKEGDLYPSVQHFICLEAAKRFEFPESILRILADGEAPDVGRLLNRCIYHRFPSPEQCLAWFWTGGRDEVFKIGSRLKFEKHPDLLRALLETGDSVLVHCKDWFMSEDTEWSIGCAEQDLRQWMEECGCSGRQLLQLCLQPLDARSAFLGGNRLGALLMELRREFRLRGFQAHTLPKLGLPVEVVVGNVSCDECNIAGHSVDSFGADAVWPNPHFLLCKKRGQPILDRAKKKRKLYEQSATAPSSSVGQASRPSPTALVASLNADQLKQTATMLVTKLAAMRTETSSEAASLRQLLNSLGDLRDRTPVIDQSTVPGTDSQSISFDTKPTVDPVEPSPSGQQEKWAVFEEGLFSVLKAAASTKKMEDIAEEDVNSWLVTVDKNDPRLRSLVGLVWPHLTIRERETALDWLLYTTKKLEALKKARQSTSRRASSGGALPTSMVQREASDSKWIMPLIKVVTTQKSNDVGEGTSGARAATPQSEGTIMDCVKCTVDWVLPETGMYPKILGPASP